MTKLKSYLPAILWAFLIFYLSSRPTIQASEVNVFDFIIKKTAHVVEYAIFFILIARAQKKKNFKATFLFGLFYAFTDELHQMFVPGRGAKLTDVLIFDTLGLSLAWRQLASKRA